MFCNAIIQQVTVAQLIPAAIPVKHQALSQGPQQAFLHENFWFLWQTPTTSLAWGTIHQELWLRSHSCQNNDLCISVCEH